MIAVTIAVGAQYERLAEAVAKSCERCTGLPTHIIRETPSESKPARYKLQSLQLFPSETVLYFDADTRFVRPWDVRSLDDIPAFAAVLDMSSVARDDDCRRYGIDPLRYFNSGIWIANARHVGAFVLADQICHAPDYRTGFRYEQTALNVAIQRLNVPVVFFDRRYNAICDPACKMTFANWCGERSPFFFNHVYGDKELFHLCWRKLGQEYAMPSRSIHTLSGTMCQHDFEGAASSSTATGGSGRCTRIRRRLGFNGKPSAFGSSRS